MIYDIWYIIFSLLTSEEQRALRIVCKSFDNIYKNFNVTRYNLDPSKYGFYHYIGNKKFEVYKFERKTKGDYLIFNIKGKKSRERYIMIETRYYIVDFQNKRVQMYLYSNMT